VLVYSAGSIAANDLNKKRMTKEYDSLLNVSNLYWTDHKGREVEISTMSDRWLNNIRKKIKDKELKQPILDEIKRRKLKRKSNGC
jgi:hypothetical protein